MTMGHTHVLLLMSCCHLYSEFYFADAVVVLCASWWWVGLLSYHMFVQMYGHSST